MHTNIYFNVSKHDLTSEKFGKFTVGGVNLKH